MIYVSFKLINVIYDANTMTEVVMLAMLTVKPADTSWCRRFGSHDGCKVIWVTFGDSVCMCVRAFECVYVCVRCRCVRASDNNGGVGDGGAVHMS